MNSETRFASLTYGLAFLMAVCAAIVSTIIVCTALLWVVAGTLDGLWQAMVAFAALISLAAAQIWLFFAALKRRDAGQTVVGTLYLLGSSAFPALVFIYGITL